MVVKGVKNVMDDEKLGRGMPYRGDPLTPGTFYKILEPAIEVVKLSSFWIRKELITNPGALFFFIETIEVRWVVGNIQVAKCLYNEHIHYIAKRDDHLYPFLETQCNDNE